MKTLSRSLLKSFSILFMLISITSSCKKDKQILVDPEKPITTELKATIDGQEFDVKAGDITSVYYSTDGDGEKALQTTAKLNADGDKLNFFIGDLKAGRTTLTPKSGTSFSPRKRTFSINEVSNTSQSYVQYFNDDNVYYAYTGFIEITIDEKAITMTWSISFKDASGREFTSGGTFSLANYMASVQPKSAIEDPTPVADKPTIENISPSSGHAGDTIAITGVNYSTSLNNNIVKFNGIDARVISATETSLMVIAPESTTGDISLKAGNSGVADGPEFTYVMPATFTSFSPESGKVGDTVTITGTNFSTVSTENIVKFNGIAGTVISSSTTQLQVTVPQNATTGTVSLNVTNGAWLTGSAFTVTVPPVQSGDWEDMGFTTSLQETTLSASVGSGFMFTGGSFPDYLYYTANGSTYTNIYDNLPFDKTNLEIHLLKAGGDNYYITTNKGVARTTDGVNWTKLVPQAGAPDKDFTGIVVRGSNVTLLSGGFLYESTDKGDTWTSTFSQGGTGLEYITSDSFGKYFYAVNVSNNWLGATGGHKIYKSANGGKNWNATGGETGLYFFGSGNQAFIDASGYTIFCLFSNNTNQASIVDQRLFKTTNQGDIWTQVTQQPYYNVKCFGDQVAYGGDKLYLSPDGGINFRAHDIPEGYAIGGVEFSGGYVYIFAYNRTGPFKYRIFRRDF